jgi:SNF2 family DNA or RNA helicase
MPEDSMRHQVEGAQFIASRRRSLLLDDPGLGKTHTWIKAFDMRFKADKGGLRGVVVCPAVARSNWRDEFYKWAKVKRKIVVADDLHDLISWERKRFDVIIMSWEFATSQAHRFDEVFEWFDAFCGDEFHRAKAEASKRKLAIIGEDGRRGISQYATWGCGLSGTIMPNDPIDIYNPLQWTGVIRSDRASFTKRYFKTIEGLRSATNKPIKEAVPDLRKMIDKVAIRRTLEDAGIDLPPIWFSNRIIDGDRRELLEFLAQHPGLSDEIYRAIDEGNVALLDSPQVATVRRLIGEAKALPYVEMLIDELKAEKDKVAVFGFHRTALEMIHGRLISHGIPSVMLRGGMSRNQSDEAIQDFEKRGNARVLVANYKSAGEALTFVSCRYIDNFERPWNPGTGDQVVRRVWRLGQTRHVFSRNITLRGSYDERVNQINEEKNNNIGELGFRMKSETGEEERAQINFLRRSIAG